WRPDGCPRLRQSTSADACYLCCYWSGIQIMRILAICRTRDRRSWVARVRRGRNAGLLGT
ncbi:hypothetical protein LPJ72_005908, partial [Coemansia sp. Benny D160-2]